MALAPGRRTFLKMASATAALLGLGKRSRAQQAARIPYVDGLCFLSDREQDLQESGLAALVLDVSAGEMRESGGTSSYYRSFDACARSITAMRRRLRAMSGAFLATRGSEIGGALSSQRTAVFLQFQGGGEPVGEDLTRLDLFYELGLRVLQITHHFNNPLGGGSLEKTPTGLTKLGFEAIEAMDALGLVADLSHASDLTARDVLATSKKPVIISHGAARALCDNPRCSPDEVVKGVAASGGVVGIFMMSFWLTKDPVPSVDHLIRQIRHVIKVGGIDAVGIANDYPISGEAHLAEVQNDNAKGVLAYHPWWQSIRERGIPGFEELPQHVVIPELNNIHRMQTIHAALERDGFKNAEVEKIMGGNWIRVLTQALG